MTPTAEFPAERLFAIFVPSWGVLASGAEPDSPAATVAHGRIVTCSRAAHEFGVARGMRLRDAQRLCPPLEVHPADPAREARLFEPVVLALEAAVAGVEVARPGLCLVRAGGPSRFYRGEENAAQVMREAVADADVDGITGPIGAGVGCADGALAAALASRNDLIVPSDETAAFLAAFDLAVLDRPKLVQTLHRLGVCTLGMFAELPADAVAGRFGAEGVAAHRLARGLDARPPAPRVPPADLTVEAEPDPPLLLVEQAAFAVKALAERLHQTLAGLGMVCDRVEIGARTRDGRESVRWWRHGGDLSGLAVAERARWQLEAWTTARRRERPDPDPDASRSTSPSPSSDPHPNLTRRAAADRPDADVVAHLDHADLAHDLEADPDTDPDSDDDLGFHLLWLRPDGLRLGGATQGTLFGPAPLGAATEAAIERLQHAFGHGAITRPYLVGGRDPEQRIARVPAGDLVPDPRGDGPWPGTIPAPPPARVGPARPVRLLDERGEPIGVSGRGELSAVPARIDFGGTVVPVTGFSDVWIAAERMWDPERADRRATLQVATADGRAYLLALRRGQWSIVAGYQ